MKLLQLVNINPLHFSEALSTFINPILSCTITPPPKKKKKIIKWKLSWCGKSLLVWVWVGLGWLGFGWVCVGFFPTCNLKYFTRHSNPGKFCFKKHLSLHFSWCKMLIFVLHFSNQAEVLHGFVLCFSFPTHHIFPGRTTSLTLASHVSDYVLGDDILLWARLMRGIGIWNAGLAQQEQKQSVTLLCDLP